MLRILFLCARASSRSLLAASILSAQSGSHWEIWSTPTQNVYGQWLAERVLHEQDMPLISSGRLIQPTFGVQWDEGVVLCSGTADT